MGPAAGAKPTAEIEYAPTSPVVDETVEFDASGSSDDGSISGYEWDIDGDGAYGEYGEPEGVTASTSFDSAGTYTIGVEITDDEGATSTERVSIEVTNDAPEASVTFSPSDPVVHEEIQLDASGSTDSDGFIERYEWDIDGDGAYGEYGESSAQTTTTSFGTAGTYTVGVKVFDNGEKTDTHRERITVTNEAPAATFSFNPSNPVADEEIQLDATGSTDSDGFIERYEWDIDGDGAYGEYGESSAQTTTTSFETAGTYTVGIKVFDNGEKTDTHREQITVTNEAPTAEIDFSPSKPAPDEEITLDTSGSDDSDGQIRSYEWDIDGDGTYGEYGEPSAQTTTTSFGTAGTYTVGVKITDNGGKTATTTATVEVVNEPPEPTFENSVSDDGLTVNLNASGSVDVDGRIVSYSWDIDGDEDYGEYGEPSGQTATYEFGEPGTYEIGLRVTDNGGISRTVKKKIGVSRKPSAAFDVKPLVAAIGEPARFDASASSDPDGAIQRYRWEFPDGTVKRGEEITYQFESGGTHEVRLTVVDSFGGESTATRNVRAEKPPEFDVLWSPDTPRDKLDVVFTANSSEAVTGYDWDFDADGEFEESGEKAIYAFEDVGKFPVRVRAKGPSGVATTTTEVVTVQQSAEFELTSNRKTIEPGGEAVVTFTVSNQVNERSLDAKLELNLPNEGTSISGVTGADMVSSRATGFVTVPPGGEKTLQVYIQYNDPGTFEVTGDAVYYFETATDASPDRRRSTVNASSVTVREVSTTDAADSSAETATSGPGFGVSATVGALLTGLAAELYRRD